MYEDYISNCNDSNGSDTVKVELRRYGFNRYKILRDGKECYHLGIPLTNISSLSVVKILENVITGHALNQLDKSDLISLHAGSLSKDSHGIVILGESGDGKSTLTFELLSNFEWRYLSDEVGLIDNDLILHPFYKPLSFLPGIVTVSENWTYRSYMNEHQVRIPKENRSRKAKLKLIVVVKYNKNTPLKIEKLSKSEGLELLFNSQLGRLNSVASLEQLLYVVRETEIIRINHNSSKSAAEKITQLFKNKEECIMI